MFCSQCGKKIDTGEKFCSQCGRKIEMRQQSTASIQHPPPPPVRNRPAVSEPRPQSPQPVKKTISPWSSFKTLMKTIILGIMLALAGVMYLQNELKSTIIEFVPK
jgi:uncharacterized membrane protein YvbJ